MTQLIEQSPPDQTTTLEPRLSNYDSKTGFRLRLELIKSIQLALRSFFRKASSIIFFFREKYYIACYN